MTPQTDSILLGYYVESNQAGFDFTSLTSLKRACTCFEYSRLQMFWPDLTFIEFPTGGTCLVFFLFSKTKLMKGIVDVHLIVIIMTSFF